MGWRKTLKERHKQNMLELEHYQTEIGRCVQKLHTLDPGSDEYEKVQQQLAAIVSIQEMHRESKRKIPKEGRTPLLVKTLAVGGAAVGLGAGVYMERHGILFSGGLVDWAKGIFTGLGRGPFQK